MPRAVRPAERVDVTVGRYRIIAGRLDERCVARAFRDRALVVECGGRTVDAAVEAARAAIARHDHERLERRDAGVPLAIEYQEALDHVLPGAPAAYALMLDAHRRAPNQTATAADLARAGGYADYEAANVHYGKLARAIAEYLGFRPQSRADGTPIWTATLATGDTEAKGGSERWRWRLRPEVVAAIDGSAAVRAALDADAA